jgi:hypothetical protein
MSQSLTSGIRFGRVGVLSATGFLLLFALGELVTSGIDAARIGRIGVDIGYWYSYYAQRWLETGVLYRPEQLAGPYVVSGPDFIFPPIAILVFVPFLYLPIVVWWLAPVAVMGACWRRYRPSLWTYPVLALILAWPRTIGQLVVGGSDLWVSMAVGLGVLYAWPFALVVMKPSFLPLALLGARTRAWWVASAALVLVALPFGRHWFDYATAIRNSGLPLTYSLYQLPITLAPIVIWLGRTRAASDGVGAPSGLSRRLTAATSHYFENLPFGRPRVRVPEQTPIIVTPPEMTKTPDPTPPPAPRSR